MIAQQLEIAQLSLYSNRYRDTLYGSAPLSLTLIAIGQLRTVYVPQLQFYEVTGIFMGCRDLHLSPLNIKPITALDYIDLDD